MAKIQVLSAENMLNGTTVKVVTDRALAQGGKFYISRVPLETGWTDDIDDEDVTHEGFIYTLTLPTSYQPGDCAPPQLIYISAWESGEGSSVYRDSRSRALVGAVAVWVGTTNDDSACETIKVLCQRLFDNFPGIDARLQLIDSNVSVKQIIWGMGEKLDHYPSLEVNQVSLPSDYVASDALRISKVVVDIYGYIVHQVPTIEAELITAFGMAVQRILNQSTYIDLPITGRVVTLCQAQNLSFDNNIWNGSRFVSSFTITWSGEYPDRVV